MTFSEGIFGPLCVETGAGNPLSGLGYHRQEEQARKIECLSRISLPPPPTLRLAMRAYKRRGLEAFDCGEPCRRAVVIVKSRANPVWNDGGDCPSLAGVESSAQLFLTDGVRAGIGNTVAETQYI